MSARDRAVAPRAVEDRPRAALGPRALVIGAVLAALAPAAHAALDLARAEVERLPNGLTVLLLPEHTLPVVSVQLLIKSGARHEVTGKTGLAHTLEHMAFRATEGFPGTEVVSRIYAAGGEWHGYTWIDQTAYFATAPRERLDLLLAIEADRLGRLLILPAEVEVERGSLLSELHGYENDPASLLYDAVAAVSFLHHPYRHNTIGWESDVAATTPADLADFYRRHYRPANAVLAVAGDFDPRSARSRIAELFSGLPAAEAPPAPPTIEPPQSGVRRVEIRAPEGEPARFLLAWRSPAAGDPDFPAFLLLQEVLAGSRGVNFLQDGEPEPARPGSRLAGIEVPPAGGGKAAPPFEIASWLPPAAQPYLFTLSGSVGAGVDRAAVEAAVTSRIGALRRAPVPDGELDDARRRLLAELVFDVETTEDAAHQLAFFEGLGARGALLALPAKIAGVTPEDVRLVAARWLRPEAMTVGWALPGGGDDGESEPRTAAPVATGAEATDLPAGASAPDAGSGYRAPTLRGAEGPGGAPAAERPAAGDPQLGRLGSGLPVLLQRIELTATVHLRVVLPGHVEATGRRAGDPLHGHTSLSFRGLAGSLPAVAARARAALDGATKATPSGAPPRSSTDPEGRLAALLEEALGAGRPPASAGPVRPLALAVAGDLEEGDALAVLERAFGDLAPATSPPPAPALAVMRRDVAAELPARDRGQSQLGYAVPAPPPTHPDHLAWRLLLWILSHGYEGRLATEAIARRGLIYHVADELATDGRRAWVQLAMGVDPEKLPAMRALLEETLAALPSRPPSAAELAEAKQALLGRRLSAVQSNEEFTGFLAAEWLTLGRLETPEEFARRLGAVDLEDVHRIVPAFLAGTLAEVRIGGG